MPPLTTRSSKPAAPAAGPESRWSRLRSRIATGVRATNHYAGPALTVLGKVGELAQLSQNPTPTVVIGATARALQELDDWARPNDSEPDVGNFARFFDGTVWGDIVTGLNLYRTDRKSLVGFWADLDGIPVEISPTDCYIRWSDSRGESRLRAVLDGMVPRAISWPSPRRESSVDALEGAGLPSPRADEILEQIVPTLDRGACRTILLHGPPGTGKSQMALWLANRVARTRIVRLGNGHMAFDPINKWYPIDVIIVDDMDKVQPYLDTMEALKTDSSYGPRRLIIYTANNADDDHVVDGAAIRCGRVDETFEITDLGVALLAAPPLDRLTPGTFERIRGWPAAALDEVRVRIETRGIEPEDLRLDEIEKRIGMKCHSVKRC